jgi:type IV pilus assembly protein PilE
MKRVRGFTLLELMIVVLVIAILAAIALSGYQKQVRKSRRAEAKQALADLSLRQEKFRSNSTTYATCDGLLSPSTCNGFNGTLTYYDVAITFPSSGTCPVASGTGPNKGNANSFIITATPKSGSDQAADTACASMVLTNDCGSITKTPTACF